MSWLTFRGTSSERHISGSPVTQRRHLLLLLLLKNQRRRNLAQHSRIHLLRLQLLLVKLRRRHGLLLVCLMHRSSNIVLTRHCHSLTANSLISSRDRDLSILRFCRCLLHWTLVSERVLETGRGCLTGSLIRLCMYWWLWRPHAIAICSPWWLERLLTRDRTVHGR